ncbi:MAG: hypothetical protein QXY45_03495 [Candidatus Aenigmatarchaeota archaeon]
MKLLFKRNNSGFSIKFKKRKFYLRYPSKIWSEYPEEIKDVFIDNVAHLLTINLPLISGSRKIIYNTSAPIFRSFFQSVVINSIPAAVDDYNFVTDDVIKKFLNVQYEFKDYKVKIPSIDYQSLERALLSLSFGKDSLLSLGLCNEIGLNPVSVYINDTVSPAENRIKLKLIKKISEEFELKFHVVRNEIEKLNDFEFWNQDESCIGYSHMMSGFCFISLPFAYYYKTRYIVLGNHQNMNFGFYNKDGFLTYPSFDQTRLWMKQQDIMIRLMTSGKSQIMSVIEPLTNIFIIRILHKRYNNIGKYQISCDLLSKFNRNRWCHNCSKCARISILMKANNIDTKSVWVLGATYWIKSTRIYIVCLMEKRLICMKEVRKPRRNNC